MHQNVSEIESRPQNPVFSAENSYPKCVFANVYIQLRQSRLISCRGLENISFRASDKLFLRKGLFILSSVFILGTT